jgi:hypothetical protein
MLDIPQEVATMRRMTAAQLRAKYGDLFGEPPRCGHKEHLIRRIAWRMQAAAEGDLSERARRRAVQLADETDLRLTAPQRTRIRDLQESPKTTGAGAPSARDRRLPMPGTILVRHYRQQTLEVHVLEEGFEYDGQRFKSLTAVAQRITGKHWNGYHFFGLRK